jgi:hypothetical protein
MRKAAKTHPMASSYKVTSRMDERVEELSKNFNHFVSVFEGAEKFSGPSLYFHKKSLACLEQCGSAAAAIAIRLLPDAQSLSPCCRTC